MLRWQDWLDQARADQATAEDLSKTHHWEWCCFACQQAAEKYMKAFLETHRAEHEGHSLNALIGRVARLVEVNDDVRDACAALNRYYIPTRYPDAHEQGAPVNLYTERDAKSALSDLRIVAEFIAPFVKPPPP